METLYLRLCGSSPHSPFTLLHRIILSKVHYKFLGFRSTYAEGNAHVLIHLRIAAGPEALVKESVCSILFLFSTHPVKEVNHPLEVFRSIHSHSVSAAFNHVKFGIHTCLVEEFIEMYSLAWRYHIVLGTVENDYRRVIAVDVGSCVQCAEGILVALERKAHYSFLRSMVPRVFLTAAAHVVKVGRT